MWSDRLSPATRWPAALISLVLALPWLHPWAPGPSPNTIPLLVSWACLALLLALGQRPSALDWARAWAWAALLSSLMGLLQYFGEAAHLGGWVYVPAYLGDAVGNLRQRNQLATLLSMGMAAVLWWQRQGLRTGQALGMLVPMALASAATSSRTGLLQMLLLPVLMACWAWTRPPHAAPAPSWRLALATLALYLLASALLPHGLAWHTGNAVSSALARMGDVSGCGSRSVLWANVLHLIAQKPWTGWGWNELKWAHYMADYPGTRFCDILGNAHNLPLHLAVTLGVPLAAAACLGTLVLLWRAHPWRLRGPSDALAWGVLAPIAVHSLLEYPLWFGPFQVATLAAITLLWPAARTALRRQRPALQALALAALCLLPLIAWDYQRVRQVYMPASQRSALWRDDPWQHARQSWWFADVVRFAEVTAFEVSTDKAQAMLDASLAALHDSPEPRVIQKLIDSARLLGQNDLADWHQAHMQKVYGKPPP